MAAISSKQRIFAIISIVLSVLAVLLVVIAMIGTWIIRSVTIDVSAATLDGVNQLSQVGRNGILRLDNGFANLREPVGEVQSAAEQLAQSVEDQGLIMTLLPAEKEQELQSAAQEIRDTFDNIKEVISTSISLVQAIDRMPFVDLPGPNMERVQTIEEGIESIRADVSNLRTNIQEFRQGAAGGILNVSDAAADLDARLAEKQDDLAALDNQLEALQEAANQLKQTIATAMTVAAIVLTLLFAWIIYALVVLILNAWYDLRAVPSTSSETTSDDSQPMDA